MLMFSPCRVHFSHAVDHLTTIIMVICQYYLQGRCKFGDSCRNEHSSRNSQQGVLRPSQFSGFGGGGQTDNRGSTSQRHSYSVSDVLSNIQQEMAIWEKSKMWPFSCFGFRENIPSLPGLEDLSMEEVRLKAYTAQKNGLLSEYQQWIVSVASEYSTYRKLLQKMDSTVKSRLIEYVNDINNRLTTSHSSDTKSSIFSSGSGRSPLLSNELQKSSFNAASNQSSAFGTSSQSLFGNTTQRPVFGQSGAGSLFGNKGSAAGSLVFGSSSVFGNAGSAFGNPGATQTSTSVFGSSAAASTFGGSVFGKTSNTQSFGTTGFGSGSTGQASGIPTFGSTGTSVFGGAGATQTSGAPCFGSTVTPQTSSTPFLSSTSSTPSSGTSMFGTTEVSNQSPFGSQSQPGFAGINQPTGQLGSQTGFGSQSVFGSTVQSGQTNQSSATGTDQSGQSTFGASVPQNQTGQSSFGAGVQQNQTSQSAFGASVQQNQTGQSAFGASVQQNQPGQSAFGASVPQNQTGQSALGASVPQNQTSQSALGASVQQNQTGQSAFGNTGQSDQSAAASQQPQPTASTLSKFSFAPRVENKENMQTTESHQMTGLFGKPASQTGVASLPSEPVLTSNIYTPLDQLTSLEKQQFEAEEFTLDRIPIRAPPKELC